MKSVQAKYLFLLVLSFLIYSCKSKKPLIELNNEHIIPIDSIYSNIFNPQSIEWINAKAKIKISADDESEKANMFLRMRKDSVIWTSFKKYTQEGARVLINKDSIYTVNRIEKTYQEKEIKEIYDKFGINPDLEFVQKLISGLIPSIDTTLLWEQKETADEYKFRSIKDDMVITFYYDKFSGLLKRGEFIDRFNVSGEWHYDDYRFVDNMAFPYLRTYTVNFNGENELTLNIEFTKVEINVPKTIKFNIPSSYSKVD